MNENHRRRQKALTIHRILKILMNGELQTEDMESKSEELLSNDRIISEEKRER